MVKLMNKILTKLWLRHIGYSQWTHLVGKIMTNHQKLINFINTLIFIVKNCVIWYQRNTHIAIICVGLYMWPIFIVMVENILRFSYYNCKTDLNKSHTTFVIPFTHTLTTNILIHFKKCDCVVYWECKFVKWSVSLLAFLLYHSALIKCSWKYNRLVS